MSVKPLITAASVLWLTLVPSTARAAYVQNGAKLVGAGAVGASHQGWSIAVSADGNTAVVGGVGDNGFTGAAWVYTRSGAVWSQQAAKLVGTGAVGAWQGWSVAVSAAGNTAVVGGPQANGTAGGVWVYTRSGGVWSQQGAMLVGTGAVGSARQGLTVAVSGDGNTAVVGGPSDNSGAGAAWVFTRSGAVWSQQGAKLVGTGAVGSAEQGTSVAVSGDGNTVVVGGPNDNSSTGAAWVFTRSGGVWSQQGAKLVGTAGIGTAQKGYSVAVSGDGNTAVVGGPSDNSGVGATWVFTRSGGVWSQQGGKLVGTGAVGGSVQGVSVSVSADGNTAVVGGSGDNSGAGATWVYTRNGGVWSQQGAKLLGTGAVGGAEQGFSVSVSADGNTALVGGKEDNSQAGAAWVFEDRYAVVIDPAMSWSQASAAAVVAGGYLVTITSAAEQAMVEAAIAAAAPAGQGGFWTNLRETGECCYVWDTGETNCYGRFYLAEPNDGGDGPGAVTENRGQLMWSNDLSRRGRWNDVPTAGLPGSSDVSRLGYVIEFGSLDPAGPCGPCVGVSAASFCNTPPSGVTTVYTQFAGVSTPSQPPRAFTRTISDVTEPFSQRQGGWLASPQATYVVTVPVDASGVTAAVVAGMVVDSINRQAGGAGFVANIASSGNGERIQMYRAAGSFTVTDQNTIPGITYTPVSPPGGGGGSGPMASWPTQAALVVTLAGLAYRALRSRHRPQG